MAPQAGIQFASYHFLLSAWDKLGATEVNQKTVINPSIGIIMIGCIHASLYFLLWQSNVRSLACGGLAGVFTKITMLPLDLAKKRLEVSDIAVV